MIYGRQTQILFLAFLFLVTNQIIVADEEQFSSWHVVKSDVKSSSKIWTESIKTFGNPRSLMLIGGTSALALVGSLYQDDITEEIQRHENYQDISSIGDDYGSAVNSVLPQFGIYLLGVGTKNDKVREFGILTTHAAILADVLTQGLKIITNSDRPDGSSSSRFGSSFPSGHASGTAALAGTIQARYGTLRAMPFHLASIYTGISRIVDDKHRPNEVIAGWALGYCLGFAVTKAWEKIGADSKRFKLQSLTNLNSNGETNFGMALKISF